MRRPLIIIYSLIFYALAEVVWWGILLIQAQPERKGMIIGEALVFIFLFLVGAYYLKKALKKEHKFQEQQKNFLLSVTHELKSPLASIKLYLETILKRDLEKEQIKSFLTNSLKDIERLDDLVENMLLATKIENQSYSFPKEKLNLSLLIDKVADRLQIHTCSTQTIKTYLEPGIELIGDKFALTSVITNLIENGVKYSPPCSEIEVKLRRENGAAVMEISDHGMGIPDEEKPRIFDKFYRVGREETRKTKGTGLGLYIVKQVLNNHQAQIKVKNNQPTGTVFEVIFNLYGS